MPTKSTPGSDMHKISSGVWVAFALVNVFFTYWNLRSLSLSKTSQSHSTAPVDQTTIDEHGYSWRGNDFPLYFPISFGQLPAAAMTIYDSTHYDLFSTPSSHNASADADAIHTLFLNESNSEWSALGLTPSCFARTHLGPEKRMFLPTMCHQTHCIEKLAIGLRDRSDVFATVHHIQHCLNYLRQWFLCAAHEGLEEGDWLERWGREDWELLGGRPSEYEMLEGESGFRQGKVRGELLCEDWTVAYDELNQNYKEFVTWRNMWN